MKPSCIRLDPSRRALIAGDKRIGLSQREFVLLTYLLEDKGGVCSRPELLSGVWDLAFEPVTNGVDVVVLRRRARPGARSTARISQVE